MNALETFIRAYDDALRGPLSEEDKALFQEFRARAMSALTHMRVIANGKMDPRSAQYLPNHAQKLFLSALANYKSFENWQLLH
jgi:hypothetical protein